MDQLPVNNVVGSLLISDMANILQDMMIINLDHTLSSFWLERQWPHLIFQ